MAGATHPTKSHFPQGRESYVPIRLGGYTFPGADSHVIDTFTLDFDCYIKSVHLSYTQTSAADIDGVTLKTVDATALTIATIGNMTADVVGDEYPLHADVIDVLILRGNKIQLVADSATGEGGNVVATVHVKPAR